MTAGSILVVDDEYGVRSGIRTILEMEGYDVDEAGDGAEALAQLEQRDFDVALLDYRSGRTLYDVRRDLPQLGGVEPATTPSAKPSPGTTPTPGATT